MLHAVDQYTSACWLRQSADGADGSGLARPQQTLSSFQSDQSICRGFAEQAVRDQAQNANVRILGVAALTTALGAGLGGAIGGGSGAGIGAAGGALAGAGLGAMRTSNAQNSIQTQYDNAFVQCMFSLGNSVPNPGSMLVNRSPRSIPPTAASLCSSRRQLRQLRLHQRHDILIGSHRSGGSVLALWVGLIARHDRPVRFQRRHTCLVTSNVLIGKILSFSASGWLVGHQCIGAPRGEQSGQVTGDAKRETAGPPPVATALQRAPVANEDVLCIERVGNDHSPDFDYQRPAGEWRRLIRRIGWFQRVDRQRRRRAGGGEQ